MPDTRTPIYISSDADVLIEGAGDALPPVLFRPLVIAMPVQSRFVSRPRRGGAKRRLLLTVCYRCCSSSTAAAVHRLPTRVRRVDDGGGLWLVRTISWSAARRSSVRSRRGR